MSNTANLGVPYVVAAQSQPEVTVNGAFDDFDGALGSLLAHSMTDANYTLNLSAVPNEALGYLAYVFTGTLTATRDIIVPANKKLYFVVNNTTGGHSIVVKTSGGTGVTVSNAAAPYTICYCDGTNVVGVGAASLAGDSDVSFTSVANGDVVTYNSGSGKWVNSPSTSATLAGDTDVDITSPANGDVLTYQSSGGKWVNAPPAGGGGGGGSSPTGTLMAYGQPNPFSGGPPAYNYGNVFNYAGLSQGNAPSIARSSVTGGLPAATRLSTTASNPTSFSWWGSYSQETVCASLLAQIQFTIALNSITATRVWVGVGFGASSTLETPTPACSLIAFRFDAAVDTNWQAVVGNGVTTVVNTGVAADTNFHQFKITRDGSGGFNFSIDGTIAANIPSGSAGMPASTSQMGDLVQIDGDGVTGAAVTLDLVSMSCWLIY
jgi:hypothetical protein